MSKDEQKVEKENTQGAVNRLTREVKELRKDLNLALGKIETLQGTVEEVLASNASLKQFVVSTRDHADIKTQDVIAEVKEANVKVTDKVEEVTQELKKKKIIRLPSKSMFNRVLFWVR